MCVDPDFETSWTYPFYNHYDRLHVGAMRLGRSCRWCCKRGNSVPKLTSAESIIMPEDSPANIYTATAIGSDNDRLSFGMAGGADKAACNTDAASGDAGLCRTLGPYRFMGLAYTRKCYHYHRFIDFLHLRF